MLTVALLQIEGCGYDQEANLAKGEAACRRAAARGADIALFPEMWNIGYGFECAAAAAAPNAADLERWRSQAVPRDGAFVTSFARLAAELGMAIAVTYLEAWPGAPRNTVTVFDRHGAAAFTYAKVHTCDFEEPEASLSPGDGFPVATLATAAGPVAVGAMICFDREFPEAARILALNGAELILVPNACPMEENRSAELRTRAFENMVAVALANYPATHDDCDGHSVAYHPFVHAPDSVTRDTLVVRAGGGEEIALARFDLDELRAWRRTEVWGRGHRRPDSTARCSGMASPRRIAAVTADATRLYVVVTWVPRRTAIAIGALGSIDFARGWYAYVGSAARARPARVARHLSTAKPPAKPLRWHADYLFAVFPARRAWLVDGAPGECGLAGGLAGLPGATRRPPRFGAGDCRCAGHLVRLPRRPRRADIVAAAGEHGAVRAFGPRPSAGY